MLYLTLWSNDSVMSESQLLDYVNSLIRTGRTTGRTKLERSIYNSAAETLDYALLNLANGPVLDQLEVRLKALRDAVPLGSKLHTYLNKCVCILEDITTTLTIGGKL